MSGVRGKKSKGKGKHLLIQEDDLRCGKLKLWNVPKRDEDKWKNLWTGCGKRTKNMRLVLTETKMLSAMKKRIGNVFHTNNQEF